MCSFYKTEIIIPAKKPSQKYVTGRPDGGQRKERNELLFSFSWPRVHHVSVDHTLGVVCRSSWGTRHLDEPRETGSLQEDHRLFCGQQDCEVCFHASSRLNSPASPFSQLLLLHWACQSVFRPSCWAARVYAASLATVCRGQSGVGGTKSSLGLQRVLLGFCWGFGPTLHATPDLHESRRIFQLTWEDSNFRVLRL